MTEEVVTRCNCTGVQIIKDQPCPICIKLEGKNNANHT